MQKVDNIVEAMTRCLQPKFNEERTNLVGPVEFWLKAPHHSLDYVVHLLHVPCIQGWTASKIVA